MLKKIATPNEIMCKFLPYQFTYFINYIQSIQYEDKPDYRFLRKIMRELFFKQNYDWNYQYDWTLKVKDGKPKKNVKYSNHFIQFKVKYNENEASDEEEEKKELEKKE